MSSLQSGGQPLQLQWTGGKVVISPADQDRFVIEAGRAVASCQGMLAFDRFWNQFRDDFLVLLHQWCIKNSDKVVSCFVPFPAGMDIRVFIVGAAQHFDFELNDRLSDVEQEFDGHGWKTDIVQLPSASAETLRSFFNPSESIQVYGNGERAQGEGQPQPRLP